MIETDGSALRLTLNGAEGRKTLAGQFIAESFGSSIQHLAFATRDVFASAARRAALGFRPLEISANFYDDLETRLGSDPALVDRMRAAGILYDRDDGGEFFQYHSGRHGDGFFLEIVERRGGYRGYGAANAPSRIAAQKRALPPRGMPRL